LDCYVAASGKNLLKATFTCMIMARYCNAYAGVMMISYEELAIICHRHSGYETAQF